MDKNKILYKLKKYKNKLLINSNDIYLYKYNDYLYKLYGGTPIINNINKYNNFLINIKILLDDIKLEIDYPYRNKNYYYDQNKLLNIFKNKYIPKLSFQCLNFLNNYNFCGKGSNIVLSANVIHSCYSQNIYIDKNIVNKIAIKLCTLDNYTCNLLNEIYNMISFSKLVSYNICSNYLLFFGCGTNFYNEDLNKNILNSGNILIPTYKRKLIEKKERINKNIINEKTYKLIDKIKLRTQNIDEYYENSLKKYSFILTNYIDGNTMKNNIDENSRRNILSQRQIFEILYSSLCSLQHNDFFITDFHLDNIIEFDDSVKTVIKIEDKLLYFNTNKSIIFIDYQVVKKYTINELKLFMYHILHFIDKNISERIINFFNTMNENYGSYCYHKCIINLHTLFEEYITEKLPNNTNYRILEYREIIQ